MIEYTYFKIPPLFLQDLNGNKPPVGSGGLSRGYKKGEIGVASMVLMAAPTDVLFKGTRLRTAPEIENPHLRNRSEATIFCMFVCSKKIQV